MTFMKKTLTTVSLLLAVALQGSSQVAPKSYLVTVTTADAHLVGHALEAAGLDVASISKSKGQVQVVTRDPESLARFQDAFAGIAAADFVVSRIETTRPYAGMNDAEEYLNYQQTYERLKALADQNPQLVKYFDLSQYLGLPKSAEGRTLHAIQISKNPSQIEDEPKILIVGQHHARELMTHQAVVDSAENLINEIKNGNSAYASAVNESAIWFVPLINPDGIEHVFKSDRMWRKNRAINSDGSRGVDLNRNYAFKWSACGQNSSVPSSDIFAGKAAMTEPEVNMMDVLNEKLRFQYMISYHSAGNEVLYPYVCGTLAEERMYYDIRDRLATEIGFGKRVASSSGEDFEHYYANYGTISFLLEIGEEFQPAVSEYRSSVWPNVQKVLPFLFEELKAPTVHLKITSSRDDAPVKASLTISQIRFVEGEKRTTDSFGSYRWRLPDGSYQLQVSAAGYRAKTVTLNVGGESLVESIQLDPQ